METQYRNFKFTLRTLAPVHIGSGEKYTSKEFIYEKGAYYFPDMGLFYNRMLELGLGEQFEKFLMNKKGRASNNRLISFVEGNKVTQRNFGGYKILENGAETKHKQDRNQGAINEVSKFMRDAYGKPYIPGSSLKGAICTLLMNTVWSEENFVKTLGRGKKIEDKSIIPWGAKKGKPYDDIFNAIRVSDSKALNNEQLILVQKWDYSSKSEAVKPIPLYRESLKPNTVVEFTITTTTKEAGQLIEQLGSYAQELYKSYKTFFLDEFPDQFIQKNLQYPIYLGAGSGAWTKTVFKQADGILQERYKRMRTKMINKGVLKLTKAPSVFVNTQNGEWHFIKNTDDFYEMGKANFIIKEIDR